MNWIDIFFGKDLAKKISKSFKGIAFLQLVAFVFHLDYMYSSQKDWIWKGQIRLLSLDTDGLIHQKYQLSDNVEIHGASSDIIFHFATFSEWLNKYTVGFVMLDTLKWIITIFILWQLSKIVSSETSFTGFSTKGVKYLRRAAIPIGLIPILDGLKNIIFKNYMLTQSTYSTFRSVLFRPDTEMSFDWLYYAYGTTILLGLAEIFRYGMQLKEETDLTV